MTIQGQAGRPENPPAGQPDGNTGLQGVIAEVAEAYFRALEADGYRPEGCNGDYFAKHLVSALGLTEEWAAADRDGVATIAKRGKEGAQRMADRINQRFWDQHDGVSGAVMLAPNAHIVSRWVGPWRADQ